MILALYLIRLLLAWLLAAPVIGHVAEIAGARPSSDLALFEPGGLFLLEAIRLGRPALAAELPRTMWILLAAAYLGLVPLAALMASLTQRGRLRLRELAAASLRPLGAFSLLLGLALSAHAVLGGLTLFVASALFTRLEEQNAALAQAAVLVTALLVAMAIGVAHDLARAHAVLREARVTEAVRAGIAALGARPLLSWALRFVAGAALVAIAAWLSGLLGVKSPIAIAGVALVHQTTALGLVALRASWLAAALRVMEQRSSRPPLGLRA